MHTTEASRVGQMDKQQVPVLNQGLFRVPEDWVSPDHHVCWQVAQLACAEVIKELSQNWL